MSKQGRKVTPQIAQNRVPSSKKGLSEYASKLGRDFSISRGAISFKSIRNSNKIAWSPVLKKWSKWVPFWSRCGGQNRCYTICWGVQKTNKKQFRFLGRFGVPKRGSKSFQNHSFFDVFPEPCFGGSASRFLIDLGVILEPNPTIFKHTYETDLAASQ